MKIYYVYLFLLAFVFISCEKNQTTDESDNTSDIFKERSYDINDDNIDDIMIEYWTNCSSGCGGSNCYISGYIKPLAENSILLKQDEENLYLQKNDTIRINSDEPFYWVTDKKLSLLSISSTSYYDSLVHDEWSIHSSMILDSYYLGIKIKTGDNNFLGWLKINIDNYTGGIEIMDKKFTSENYILIGK